MIVKFISLKLHNYKVHRDLAITFGEITRIIADNAQGKTSIIESIAWISFGTDLLGGTKYDPAPVNYSFDEVRGDLLLSVDEKELLLTRTSKSGKAGYMINEVPKKATEFDELVKSLFDKDTFLSLFNPGYFPSMKWEDQRKLLLGYVTPPANKEVFAVMLEDQAAKLAELVKKHSMSDLESIHKENKNAKDKAYIAAQSRTKTLQDQLDRLAPNHLDIDLEATHSDIAKVESMIVEARKAIDTAAETNSTIAALKSRIQALQERVSASAGQWKTLRDEPIEDTCKACKQPLQGEAVEAVTADKEMRMEKHKATHNDLVAKRKEAEAALAELEPVDVTEQMDKVRKLQEDRQTLVDAIRDKDQRQQLQQQIEQAKKDEETTLASRNESVFILDALKDFAAKEAELMAAKVQGLFKSLSLRLFEKQKNGEIKNTFEIELDGKPYRKLSLSESIRAGLEIRDVISQQSGIICPTFVDNSESITRFTQPNGQLIISRVVAGQELTIESEDIP